MSVNLSNAPMGDPQSGDVFPSGTAREKNLDSGVWRLADITPLHAVSAAPKPPSSPDTARPGDREIYERFSPMVRRIALKTLRSLPRTIAVDDIVSMGWVGMAEALFRRPPDMPDGEFEAYASYRIRGAILDYLRTLDPLSRRLRAVAREIRHATSELTHRLGRVPTQDEIAAEMGWTLCRLQKALAEIHETGVDRVEDAATLEAPCDGPSPEALAAENQLIDTISKYKCELPERLQVVLALHYGQERSLREIGEVLGVTESRVCQLHAEAVRKIRARVEGRRLWPGRLRPESRSPY